MFGVAEKFRFKSVPTYDTLLLWFLLLPMLSMPSQNGYADIPDKAVLDELRSKLLEKQVPPDCLPSCAQIPQMKMTITDKELAITLQIHAQQSVAIPLPAEYEQWFPNQVVVDGKIAQGLYRDDNGLWINLSEGEHQVVLGGATPLLSKFTLPLPLKPNWVSIQSTGWQVIGVQDNNQVDDSTAIYPGKPDQTAAKRLRSGARTTCRRLSGLSAPCNWAWIGGLSPGSSGFHRQIPPWYWPCPCCRANRLLTPGVRVKEGKVEVNIAAQQTDMQWESTLEKSEKIDFVATETEQWIEVLKADVSPIWHIETSGIAMIHLNNDGQWLPEWHPWPGEKITLQITRPEAVEGQTLTIDNSRLSIKPGQRNQEAELNISLRSSQGSQHTLILPEKAVLQSVAINGADPTDQAGRQKAHRAG